MGEDMEVMFNNATTVETGDCGAKCSMYHYSMMLSHIIQIDITGGSVKSFLVEDQGIYAPSSKMSYHQILWRFKASRLDVML